jgi:hypothetical protein
MRTLLLTFIFAVTAAAADWRAGTQHSLESPNLPKAAHVFLPENWAPDRKWPVIFFYPWTGGPANTSLMREHTGGRDFIIVGMPPREDGPFSYTPEVVALEGRTLRELRDRLGKEAALDPARVFVAGFSKGGWLAALLLAHESGLAGGCVLGGGWVHHQHTQAKKFASPKYVFIGAGRLDGNFPPSLRAAKEFEKLGARVTFDIWPETGHEIPKGGAVGLRQWLALIAHGGAVLDEAARWAEAESERIAAIANPVEEWDAWRRFTIRPFTRAAAGKWAEAADARLAKLAADPAVAAEIALDRELSSIHQREIHDMRVTTLETVGPRYEALAKRAPDTRSGRLAAHDAARIKKLWETVPPK